MINELVFDAHIGAWTYVDFYEEKKKKKEIRKLNFNMRSGFYPYEYNFLYSRRDGVIQCSYCGKFFIKQVITRDHIYPKSLGGELTTPACNPCNETKANKKPIQWALEISGVEEEIDAAVA